MLMKTKEQLLNEGYSEEEIEPIGEGFYDVKTEPVDCEQTAFVALFVISIIGGYGAIIYKLIG